MTELARDSTGIYDLRLKPLWTAFRGEGLAFALLCTYMMFEYVRPQQIYPSLGFFPWSAATMAAAVAALVASRGTTLVSSPANGALAIFTVVLVCSSVEAYQPALSFAQFNVYFLWLVAYALIVNIVTTERRMLLLMLAFVLYNLKMSQFAMRSWVSIGFAFRNSGTGGAPGWFQNSGEFGAEMCVFFPIVACLALGLRPYLKRWKFLVLLGIAGSALVGMVASSSRGALMGGAAVLLFLLVRSRHKVRGLVAVAVVGTVVALAIPAEQVQRLSASGTDGTSISRLTYWKHGIEMTNSHPWFGIGYANWIPYYQDHFGYQGREEVAHNTFIQAASEMGYSGLLALLLLIGCTFMLNSRTRSRAVRAGTAGRLTYFLANGLDGALIGFLVSGFFMSVLYYPYLWINLGMTAALNTVANRLPVAATVPRASRAAKRAPIVARGAREVSDPGLQPAFPRR